MASRRPRILHVDEDETRRAGVAEAMRPHAHVVSVASLAEARTALAKKSFDLAVLDLAMLVGEGPELLPELCGSDSRLIPIVLLSAQGADLAYADRMQRALEKSSNTPDRLIEALKRRFGAAPVGEETPDRHGHNDKEVA